MTFETLTSVFNMRSLIDIALVAFLFYHIISMLKGTRAAQILIGILFTFVAYVFSNILQFETLHWIISKFYSSFIIVVIVLFQDDIRRLLTRFGRGPFFSGLENRSGAKIIEEVMNAARSLSHERIGALIVFERSIGLDKLHDHSVGLDALVSEQLLVSIFQSFSPLHDGAVIIQKNRMSCASAQLPLSKNPRFSKKLGTRHSAAVGISEETDAVVLVVSEETGVISIAWEGDLQKQASSDAAKKMLYALLLPRGQKSPFATWFEEKVLYPYQNFFFFRSRSDEHSKIKEENSLASKHISAADIKDLEKVHIRFPRHAEIKEMFSPSQNFVISSLERAAPPSAGEQHSAQDNPLEEGETPISNKNEALKGIVSLPSQDRFDPPLPQRGAPRDVSIGGVSLNPPIEKKKQEEN